MKQKVITARVSAEMYGAIAERAAKGGASLSAVAARLLAVGLSQSDAKPSWALEFEQRLSQLEAAQPQSSQGRKGKRRR